MEETKTEKMYEKIGELTSIKEEIRSLVTEALELAGNDENAKNTWFAQIIKSLDNNHEWLPQEHTMQDAIDEMMGID